MSVNICLRNELTTYAQSNNNNTLIECDCDVIRSQLRILLLSGNDLALISWNVRHFVLPTTELNNSIAHIGTLIFVNVGYWYIMMQKISDGYYGILVPPPPPSSAGPNNIATTFYIRHRSQGRLAIVSMDMKREA